MSDGIQLFIYNKKFQTVNKRRDDNRHKWYLLYQDNPVLVCERLDRYLMPVGTKFESLEKRDW